MVAWAEPSLRQMAEFDSAQAMVERGYALHGRALFSLCMRMTGQRALAEDLVQETFIRLLKHWQNIQSEAHLKAWLYRAASNLVISSARKRGVRQRAAAWLTGRSEERPLDPAIRGAVQEGLMRLSESYRAVLLLHDVVGMTQQEIAEMRGVPLGTVQSQLYRARLRLGKLLGSEVKDEVL